jgi:hypothetical protein
MAVVVDDALIEHAGGPHVKIRQMSDDRTIGRHFRHLADPRARPLFR